MTVAQFLDQLDINLQPMRDRVIELPIYQEISKGKLPINKLKGFIIQEYFCLFTIKYLER